MSQFFNQPIPWPQPQNYPPLPGREGFFPNYMPLPLLSAAVDEAQNNIKAPRPLIFSTALAAIAVAIQGLFDVRKPNGQRVPLSLMLLTIANSGERKSTVENVFLGAICSGLMKPDTHLGENARHIEVSDDQATSCLFR